MKTALHAVSEGVHSRVDDQIAAGGGEIFAIHQSQFWINVMADTLFRLKSVPGQHGIRGDFGTGTAGGRDGDDRQCCQLFGFVEASGALLWIGHEQGDGLSGVQRGTAADADDEIRLKVFSDSGSFGHGLHGRVFLNIIINEIWNGSFVQNGENIVQGAVGFGGMFSGDDESTASVREQFIFMICHAVFFQIDAGWSKKLHR